MRTGILGFPQSGKTTLFNVLARAHAPTGGFASAAGGIHVGTVQVPDARLEALRDLFEPKKYTPAQIEYVDLAGAPGGRDAAALLPPQITSADVLVLVVRAFEDPAVHHDKGSVDAMRDLVALQDELVLKDLQVVESRAAKIRKAAQVGQKEAKEELPLLEQCLATLEAGDALRTLDFTPDEERRLRGYGLLSAKPLLVVFNVGEGQASGAGLAEAVPEAPHTLALEICGKAEMEIAELPEAEAREFMDLLGIAESGLDRVIRTTYALLGLRSFFTVGKDEVRAWTIPAGTPAVRAAGKIHSDLERGFIRAEVVAGTELLEAGGLAQAKAANRLRVEGKEYEVQDGMCSTSASACSALATDPDRGYVWRAPRPLTTAGVAGVRRDIMQCRLPLLVAGVLAAGIAAASPEVRLDIDPDYNGFTHEAPVVLGQLTGDAAPLDPTSFVLYLDGEPVYRGGSRWQRDAGDAFSYRITDEDARSITFEYRRGCRGAALAEGTHTVRLEARDLAGNPVVGRPLEFRIDRTAPGAAFDGLELAVEDAGSGPVLDARLEPGPLAICPSRGEDAVRSALATASADWMLEESEVERGLKVDLWRIDAPSFPGIREGVPLGTEWVGRTLIGSWSGGVYRADLVPLVKRQRLATGTQVSLVAYSTRYVLRGNGDLPVTLVETLQGLGLPVRHDRRRGEVVVYTQGPQDRAGNALPPLVSLLHDGGPGHQPILDPPVAGRMTPPAPEASHARGRSGPQGAVQQPTILTITDGRVVPNPFNPFAEDAAITFILSEAATVEVDAYDRTGDFVDRIFEGPGSLGTNLVRWGGQTEDGRKLGNGVYLIRVVASNGARKESVVLKAVVWNAD